MNRYALRSFKRCSVLAAYVVWLLFALPARADLISIDLDTPGDGLVTRDTVNNLDWLNLNLTKNLSYDQLFAGAGGWYAEGWRHAKPGEVCGLFGNFLPTGSSCGRFSTLPAPVANGIAFLDRMGMTATVGQFRAAIGIMNDPPFVYPPLAQVLVDPNELTSTFYTDSGTIRPDIGGNALGNFLVRSTIPEPSTGVLGMLGLLQLGWWRRHMCRRIATAGR